MAISVHSRIPYGNAKIICVDTAGDIPEVHFCADPHGGPEALWFCFRLEHKDGPPPPAGKVKITLRNFETLLGAGQPAKMMPVYRQQDQGWQRLSGGKREPQDSGCTWVSWLVPYPSPTLDVALCYPYGPPELNQLLKKSKGYWKQDMIGVSRQGRPIQRLSNRYGAPGEDRPGIYFLCRQHAGETPGSWVLDGALQRFSQIKRDPFLIWAVPLADVDGVHNGDYGKDGPPIDVNRAWGIPPRRHETLVIQTDLEHRWKHRCRPVLALDFHAPGACDTGGAFCFLPSPERAPESHRLALKFAHVLRDTLTSEYAAESFARVADYPSRWLSPNFTSYISETFGICCLTLETPYAAVEKTVLSQKRYREIGMRVADTILDRFGH